jgi:tetratricopeptide (TPR) repeat protein
VDPTWEAAVAHLEARRFAEAVPLLREVDRTHPDDPSVLWNLGIALAAVADHSAALATWERLDANGDDWRVVAKRIQSSQSLGNADEVRQLRERLIALRARPDAPKDLVEAERYCREQFRLDDHLVFAYEHFDPSGRRMVFYSFAFGSAVLFAGTLLHRGGAHRAGGPRLDITPQYCEGWVRQIENLTLAVPPELARNYSERVQALLGYDIFEPTFIGYVDGMHPKRLLGPEYAATKQGRTKVVLPH